MTTGLEKSSLKADNLFWDKKSEDLRWLSFV